MKAATVKEIKQELSNRSPKELLELCLRLSRFKKENKELLTYLLYEASNEESYINSIKSFMDVQFEEINTKSYYYIRKSSRKILTNVRKYIRYSQKKETEVELLIYFCTKLKSMTPSYKRSTRMKNMYDTVLRKISKTIPALHEDLQYDYGIQFNELKH